MLKKVYEVLNLQLVLYVAIGTSFIGLTLVLGNLLLIKGFPLELIGIEIELIENLPISYFLISLIYWNVPLALVLLARSFLKK